ncbi:MAG TPA: class I SAM-dependent methyltransferase [Vicinamibacterales bacterium]|jgi:SAM-dependent methyltransferase
MSAAAEVSPVAVFTPVRACWICTADRLRPIHECLFDLREYERQDPELAAYTGARVQIGRCDECEFGQPLALPSLPRFFERMYDQRWSDDWLASEFRSEAKTRIFGNVLDGLERRLPRDRRSLIDIGAHVGRFLKIASGRAWVAEGIETNPQTAAYARQMGATIHPMDLRSVSRQGCRYDAVTLIDVLEHIPEPRAALQSAAKLLSPGGWVAIKVPCGPNQLQKERVRAAIGRASRVSIADNLVHVNHFSPLSLQLALEIAGFTDIELGVAAPELPGGRTANAIRLGFAAAARATGGVRSPLAFNLQAYGRLPS